MYNAPFSVTAVLVAAFFMLASPVVAAPQCDKRDKVLGMLAKKYREAPIAAGVTNTGGLVEVLTDHKGGTWTIIVTSPQGMSCLVAAGEGWRNMKAPQPQGSVI